MFTQAFASNHQVFKSKTDDLTVDNKCEDYKVDYFLREKIDYFLVGTRGLSRAGFDEEIEISRDEARLLWKALNPHSKESEKNSALKKINNQRHLKTFLEVLEKGSIERGAKYYAEGEILEVLSYYYLPQSDTFQDMLEVHFGDENYTLDDYFITGGVTYHTKSGQTVGELDVVVGDSRTCTVFAIGEAKLGGKKNKAVRQLDRIKQFLRSFL